MTAVVVVLIGAALQAPLIASTIRTLLDSRRLLQDSRFTANVIDGGTVDGPPEDEESPWAQVLRLLQPKAWQAALSICGVALTVIGAFLTAEDL